MITIALDEQGDFENLEGKLAKAPVFIGGVVYDDREEDADYNNEKNRLQKYLKQVCFSVGCRYPQDLHYSSETNNGQNVAMVKAKFTETVKEFLEAGTWDGSAFCQSPEQAPIIFLLPSEGKAVNGTFYQRMFRKPSGMISQVTSMSIWRRASLND